jgi:sulfate adenylyltransferase
LLKSQVGSKEPISGRGNLGVAFLTEKAGARRRFPLIVARFASAGLVEPHGGRLVNRICAPPDGWDALDDVVMTEREAADLDVMACGALSPLEGFMGRPDYDRVLEDMRLASGLPWTLPVCLATARLPRGDRVLLRQPGGDPVAVMDVEDAYVYDREREEIRCFGTSDVAHPGVARLRAQKRMYIAGPVHVFRRRASRFGELTLDPAETRREFQSRRWRRVVGFQTRNPLHRAHEYVTKGALETADGLLMHPLVGETKADDVPADTRIECYRVMIERYYPTDRVLLAAFPAAMRYAGPREAVWHAICRRNYGCSHFIVGRDHAGVGPYYGTYDAQRIFDRFEPGELGIEPLFFEQSFFCRACAQLATAKTCPHGAEEHEALSGSRVRRLISRGERLPLELSRPEVSDLLLAAYA